MRLPLPLQLPHLDLWFRMVNLLGNYHEAPIGVGVFTGGKRDNHSSDTFQSGGESLSQRCDTPRPTCSKERLRIARWIANPGHTQMLGCSRHGDETLWDNDTFIFPRTLNAEKEVIRRPIANRVHGNLTPAGYSAGSVEKYHYTLSLSWPYP